jgi:hypothetical protein
MPERRSNTLPPVRDRRYSRKHAALKNMKPTPKFRRFVRFAANAARAGLAATVGPSAARVFVLLEPDRNVPGGQKSLHGADILLAKMEDAGG